MVLEEVWLADLARFLTVWVKRVRIGVSLFSELKMPKPLLEVPFNRGGWPHA